MASTISQVQRRYLQDLLARDLNSNHQLLTYYLKLILSNRPLELDLPDKTKLKLSPEEAWQEITAWARDNEVSLPMGDRGSRKIRASRLLNYLEINVQGKSREAAANFRSILDSAKDTPLKNLRPETAEGQTYKKANELRNLQYKLINDKILGKLTTAIQQTQYLKRFAGDPYTFSVLSALLAADAANLRPAPGKSTIAIAEEITQLIQLRSGDGALNNASHLAYSAKADQELPELTSAIEAVIQKEYGGSPEGQKAFRDDMSRLSSLPQLTTIADIPTLVDLVAGHDLNKDKLVESLRKNIIATTTSGFVSGEVLIRESLKSAGFPDTAFDQLSSLAPLIEEVRQNEVAKILGGNVLESDPRLLHTLSLTRDIGVSLDTPWRSRKDLDRSGLMLEEKYKTKDLTAFLQAELAKEGKDANFEAIIEIVHHFKYRSEYERYKYALDHDVLFSVRDKIGRARGTYAATKAPIDRFSQKIGKTIWAVDDFIHSPFNYLAEKWEQLEEKIPLLNPARLISDKTTLGQLWIADKILNWSTGVATKASTSGKWYAGIFTHISDFSKGFVQAGGSWSHASFNFVEKKWGNILDWSARTILNKKDITAVKAAVASKLWSGFTKIAPGIATKLSNGAIGKVVASFLAGTLSGGTTILIQAGLMAIGAGLKGIWEFITNQNGFRDKIIRRLPAILSIASSAVVAIPAAVVAWVIATGSALIGAIGTLVTTLFSTVFLPALIAVGALIAGVFLLFQVFNITSHIDSGPELFAAIFCNDDEASAETTAPVEQSPGNSVLSCANCLVDYLTACYGPAVTGARIQTTGIGCLLAKAVAPEVAAIIERSATSYTYLQCVGFVQASIACAGGSLEGKNACNYTSGAAGYQFVSGLSGARPGDPIVFNSSGTCSDGAPGHIGIMSQDAGALVCLVDANQVCNGCVSANNCLPKTGVAGHLRRI